MAMYAAKFVFEHGASLQHVETVHDNVFWQGAAPRISVCVPAYRHDVSALMAALAQCEASSLAEIIIYDDGSQDHDLLARMQSDAGHVLAAVRIVSCWQNRGRAAACLLDVDLAFQIEHSVAADLYAVAS